MEDPASLRVAIPLSKWVLVASDGLDGSSVATALPADGGRQSGSFDQAPHGAGGPLISVLGGEADSITPVEGIMTVVSTVSGDLGEGSDQPVFVIATGASQPGSNLSLGDYPPSVGGMDGGSPSGGGGVAEATGVGGLRGGYGGWDGTSWPGASAVSTEPNTSPTAGAPAIGSLAPSDRSTSIGASTFGSTPAPVDLPDDKHVVLEGLVPSSDGYEMVQIPLTPDTKELGLSLQAAAGDGPSQGPILGSMSVVDRQGHTLEDLGPLYNGPGGEPPQAVTLAFNDVPAGGSLLVQVAASSAAAATATGPSVPYVMSVQRMESPSSSSSTAASAISVAVAGAGRTMLGVLPGSTDRQGQGWSGGDAAANADGSTSNSTVATDTGQATPAAEESAADEVSPSDFDARVATGPLAARTAAPVGPNLSGGMLDQAPAVDRHELALSQGLAGIDSDEDRSSPDPSVIRPDGGRSHDGRSERGSFEPSPESIVAIAGLGPLPLKVATVGGGWRRDEFEALHAVMTRPAGADDGAGDFADEDPILAGLAAPASSDGDRRSSPDFVTSACILAIGMGLMTGPIFPDLLRLIPPRSSRWRPIRAAGDGLAVDSPRERRFGGWFRRRLSR